MANFFKETYYDEQNGVYRWKSNDRVPFDDMLDASGVSCEIRMRSIKARQRDLELFLTEYDPHEPTPEEVDGMIDFLFLLIGIVVLFGGAALVINVITGQ